MREASRSSRIRPWLLAANRLSQIGRPISQSANGQTAVGPFVGLVALCLAAACLVAGCGSGGSGSASVTPHSTFVGSARFVIHWPAATRVIPTGTGSIKIEIQSQTAPGTDVVPADIENAPGAGPGATTSHQFNGLPLGPQGQAVTFNVVATAYSQANAQGIPIASGVSTLTVSQANTPSNPAVTTITMVGVVDHFAFSLASTGPKTGYQIVQNQTETLVATPVDALGNMVLVDPTKIVFTSSNPAVATVTQLNDVQGNRTTTAAVTGGAVSGGVNINVNYTGLNPITGTPYTNLSTSQAFVVTAANGLTTARYLYVVNNGSNNLSIIGVNQATGVLTNTGTTVAVGSGPRGIAVTGTGQYLYVANSGGSPGFSSGTVSGFVTNAQTGALSPANGSPALVGAKPVALAIDPRSQFLYVVNNGDNTVSQFLIDQTSGFLLADSPAAVPTGASPVAITVDPQSRFAYVANSGDNTISGYTIDSTSGVLTSVGPAAALAPGDSNPTSLSEDPSGRYLIVVNGSNTVTAFAINQSTGVLTLLGTVPVGAAPSAVGVLGNHVYVANRDASTITEYTIGAGGSIQTGATIAAGPTTGAGAVKGPNSLAVDPSGYFIYTTNLTTGNVAVYAVDPITGALTFVNSPVAVGANPVGLVATAGAAGSVSVTAQ